MAPLLLCRAVYQARLPLLQAPATCLDPQEGLERRLAGRAPGGGGGVDGGGNSGCWGLSRQLCESAMHFQATARPDEGAGADARTRSRLPAGEAGWERRR